MNRNLVGFVWRQIPVVSQFKLEKDYGHDDSFDSWAKSTIDDYERRCCEAATECEESVNLLKSKGCTNVVVSPDAIGSIRLVLFDRFLAEIAPLTFVMVTSWGDFGSESIVLDFVDRALARNVLVITDQHLSLMDMPDDRLYEAYNNLVRPQIIGGYRYRRSRQEQVIELLRRGMTPIEIQEQLKISKSTYYRLASLPHRM